MDGFPEGESKKGLERALGTPLRGWAGGGAREVEGQSLGVSECWWQWRRVSEGVAGGEQVEVMGGEEKRRRFPGRPGPGRRFYDRRPVRVGCCRLRTEAGPKMEEPESQEPGFVLLEKPRGTGSVLAIDAAFSSLLHSFVRHIFSLLLRDGDGNTEAAQTQTLPSERI